MSPPTEFSRHPASFRDPAAFLYRKDGVLYRKLSHEYLPHYEKLKSSGLYDALTSKKLLIAHEEVDRGAIRPEELPFVSLPSEWTFAMLRDSALLTIDILKMSLEHGMILKDASARNVQFIGSKPIFIDTTSFELFEERPWQAYRQFCEHFIVPFALMSYGGCALGMLQRQYTEGIPLEVAAKALPFRACFNRGLLIHLYGHQKFAKGSNNASNAAQQMTREQVLHLAESLRSAVAHLPAPSEHGEWSGYDGNKSYDEGNFAKKQYLVREIVRELEPTLTWDIGANDGHFSRIAAEHSKNVIAFESDFGAVEQCYRYRSTNVLPLFFDFRNPSGGAGVLGQELPSIFDRTTPDFVMMLALVHHLSITHNIPFDLIAEFCRKTGANHVLIEWIEPTDPLVPTLIARKTSHHPYDRSTFDAAFASSFTLAKEEDVSNTRSLLLFRAK